MLSHWKFSHALKVDKSMNCDWYRRAGGRTSSKGLMVEMEINDDDDGGYGYGYDGKIEVNRN